MFLSVISKALGFSLDFYGFRLEHRFNLSNQRLFSWLKDEFKGWVLGLVMATVLAEIVYALIRTSPQYWWIIGWLIFMGLFVFFAQIAPVVLFPLFYKFVPCRMTNSKPGSCDWASAPERACVACMNGSSQKKARRPTPR